MAAAEAFIATERGARYLAQLCKHATAMSGMRGHGFRRRARVSVEWAENHGVITFEPWGRCTVDATDTGLRVRVDAADEENLRRIQEIIGHDLDRFGRRAGLTVRWQAA